MKEAEVRKANSALSTEFVGSEIVSIRLMPAASFVKAGSNVLAAPDRSL